MLYYHDCTHVYFFGNKYDPRYPLTLWAYKLNQNRNKHLGRFLRTSSQQNNLQCSDQAELKTSANDTQILSNATISPEEFVFRENPPSL